jgi:hypothetical protein
VHERHAVGEAEGQVAHALRIRRGQFGEHVLDELLVVVGCVGAGGVADDHGAQLDLHEEPGAAPDPTAGDPAAEAVDHRA